MYLAGFYSPKKRSGVTETSLGIFRWFRDKTDISVAYVSTGTLQIETPNEEMIHQFTDMTLTEQKKELIRLRKEYDIVIFDGSSRLSEEVLKILPICDRLFILGEENMQFAEALHALIYFNETFDTKSKKLIHSTNNEKTLVVKESQKTKVGFMKNSKELHEIAQLIYSDYSAYYLKLSHSRKMESLIKRFQQVPPHQICDVSYQEGLSFQKSILLQQYTFLRLAMHQPYPSIIQELFPRVFHQTYEKSLSDFRNEVTLTQIQFFPPATSPKTSFPPKND